MKTKWKVSFLLVILILSYLTFWNYKNRIYDWDMPGYLGCLYTSRFPDSPEKVRNLTFGFIEKEAPADQYNDIIGLKPVDRARQVFKNDTQSFTEQIPYFQIKAGYNLAISFFLRNRIFSSYGSFSSKPYFLFYIRTTVILYLYNYISSEISHCSRAYYCNSSITSDDLYVQGFHTGYVYISIFTCFCDRLDKTLE
ncbi:hypothetical protein ACJ5H0_11100 [Chryseobacterium proteolyticum]